MSELQFYTIKIVSSIPLEEVIRYIRSRLPGRHFQANEKQLRYLCLQLLNSEGRLAREDSQILNSPFIGKIIASDNGDSLEASVHLLFDLGPGTSYLSYL